MEATSLNLEIGGHLVGVACGTREVADQLRAGLAEHIISEHAPLGFVLRAPTTRGGMFVLTDRCGFALSRSRRVEPAMSALVSLLSGFLEPAGWLHRFVARALVKQGTAALCLNPVTYVPTLVERRLLSTGYSILDRLAVDVDDQGRIVVEPVPWPSLASGRAGLAHRIPGTGRSSFVIDRVLVPGLGASARQSTPELLAAIAATAITGDRAASLYTAARILANSDMVSVDLEDQNGLYRAL